MSYADVEINAIRWSRLGTTIDIGYRSSESDGLEDDWVLGECYITVTNEEIDPFIKQIADKFKTRMQKAVREDLGNGIY